MVSFVLAIAIVALTGDPSNDNLAVVGLIATVIAGLGLPIGAVTFAVWFNSAADANGGLEIEVEDQLDETTSRRGS